MAKLHFYYSAMNAGKSTNLLQSSYNYRERGMDTLLFTPQIDDRFGHNVIASRIGLEEQAVAFSQDMDFYAVVRRQMASSQRKICCVLIDEAQFLTREQVWQLTEVVDKFSLPVLAYGLRTDYMGEPFAGSQYLLAWAEELTEIKTICHCGRKATMNLKIDPQGKVIIAGEQVEIGGNERYISVCRQHFKRHREDGKI